MFLLQFFIGIIALAIALAIAILLASATGTGWWGFAAAVAAQVALGFLAKGAMKPKRGGWKKALSSSWFGRSALVLGVIWLLSAGLNQITDAMGILSTWSTLNFATTLLGAGYLWWARKHRDLNWAEFLMHCLMVLGIGVVLTYSSIPYEAVGDSFVAATEGETPYLLSLISWLGPVKPLIAAVLGSAQGFTTFLFVLSTTVQVLSWKAIKGMRSGPERNMLIASAAIFYSFELILNYREYPFILAGENPLSIKDLLDVYIGAASQDWGALDAIKFSAIAFVQCLSSVLALDIMISCLLGSSSIEKVQPSPRGFRQQRRTSDPYRRQRPQRRTTRGVTEL